VLDQGAIPSFHPAPQATERLTHLHVQLPQVGNETREWRNGEMLLFDTSLIHEAANTADVKRYILMLRVWHPELSSSEVEAIKYIFECLDTPEIIE